MPRLTSFDTEQDKLARFDRIQKAIVALEKQQKQILKQGELAPPKAWVARYQVRQNTKKYWSERVLDMSGLLSETISQ